MNRQLGRNVSTLALFLITSCSLANAGFSQCSSKPIIRSFAYGAGQCYKPLIQDYPKLIVELTTKARQLLLAEYDDLENCTCQKAEYLEIINSTVVSNENHSKALSNNLFARFIRSTFALSAGHTLTTANIRALYLATTELLTQRLGNTIHLHGDVYDRAHQCLKFVRSHPVQTPGLQVLERICLLHVFFYELMVHFVDTTGYKHTAYDSKVLAGSTLLLAQAIHSEWDKLTVQR